MKIKKYVAATMPEAMNMIRKELGADAVILNSKEVNQGGFLGFFKKRKIEVIAALDPQPIKPKAKVNQLANKNNGHMTNAPSAAVQNDSSNLKVLDEIKYLKQMLELQSNNRQNVFASDYQVAFDYLVAQEVSGKLAEDIVHTIVKQHQAKEIIATPKLIIDDIQVEIENRLNHVTFQGIDYSKQVIQFVGPTGVGKTTTLAKIAAQSKLRDRKKVAFITTDTYRIAAIEQLRTYAKILDVPVEVAYSIADYHLAIKKFASYDLILVDTAGRNFRDEKYVQEVMKHIESDVDVETYLVLSLIAKPKDLLEIQSQFQYVPIKEIIFTKLDETRQYGSMLSLTMANNVGVAYMTNGQDVPEDLIKPSPHKISSLIVEEFMNA